MNGLLPALLLLSACDLVIDSEEHQQRLDADGDGYKDVIHGGDDCDDSDSAVNPGAQEFCNGVDDDCDDSIDEDAVDLVAWAFDNDGDGYPGPLKQINACEAPDEHWILYGSVPDDCNDDNDTVHPQADELCDGIDQDCDEDIDEGVLVDGYVDDDGDNYGDYDESVQGCPDAEGFAVDAGDCNDSEDDIYPGAEEVCGNGIDEDCDGDDLLCRDQDLSSIELWGDGPEPNTRYGSRVDVLGPLAAASSPVGAGGQGTVWLLPDPLGGDLDALDAAVAIQGVSTDDGFGTEVLLHQQLLDIGRPTLVVSAIDADGGTLYLFDIEAASTTTSTEASAILTAPELSMELGSSLARSGDLDGDTIPDLLVGSEGYDGGAGAVWVIPGPITDSASLSTDWPHFVGEESGDNAGRSVSSAGDVDGDGVEDIVVGAWLAGNTYGATYVVHGPLEGGQHALEDADVRILGHADGDLFGYPVTGGGDIDGDGHDDIAALAIGFLSEFGELGLTYVFTELADDDVLPDAATDATATVQQGDLRDTDSQDGLGLSLESDLNADGKDDLVLGHPNHEETSYGDGAVYLLFGPLEGKMSVSAADYVMHGADSSSEAGYALAVQDSNDDGSAELLIGDPGYNGQRGGVFLLDGSTW